ncbi:hypothetical protein [Flavobacterium lindanitolerans]|uniref:hypothetical protein n=1 Tax=Flavobacterium lindanitolerans TaxID=428988 RepID=UPI0023F02843|nr:hypothetical protein [Flavobacterium lindanitolerans]
MKCKLCLHEKPLLKRSHIVPNFMYKSMFNGGKRLVSINTNDIGGKVKFMQTGYTESNLLCANCDNGILSRLERFASLNIYSEPSANSLVTRKEYDEGGEIIPYIRFENLDYTNAKLFFLSIIWRCHISKLEVFSDVNLGEHAEQIRRMILDNDAGDEKRYEVVLIHIDTDGSRPSKAVIDPRQYTSEGNTFCIFHINEIMYHFNISEHNKIDLFTKASIQKDNIMDIAKLKGKWARMHFDMYMGRKLLMKSNIKH